MDAIRRHGLPQPGKSACFFCPSSKKHEVFDLAIRYPELAKRALAIEQNADLHSVKGLGRSYSWEDYLIHMEPDLRLFIDPCEVLGPEPVFDLSESEPDFCDAGKISDCGCYDGDD